jgi:glycosyltransferase involved in cell wall biosynthesis
VAPNAASFPELIEDGVSGVLAPRPDSASFASALIAILRQPGRARALGEAAARRAASAFSWDAAARRLRELYAELIARSRLGL